MNSSITGNIIRFILLALVQISIFNNIDFLGYINPYVYILFIAFFPVGKDRLLLIFLSFFLGLTIDMFLDSGGIHAAASVCIAYARPVLLKSAFGTMYEHQSVKFDSINLGQTITYIALLTLVHHVVLFSLEVFNPSKVILILKKTLFSGIFTILLCVIISIIFNRRK
ncbi:rod shape-determining protein MreD [Seonamhaeicola sp. ML3]|uniref:rod shape-determining protein MreD n=1 Tax=Seonamhaeicola sp. ML3 TaxID=2937786 RepID=UPI00200C5F31|nr:rod shape-determining protein MreD [Seonamhaeicola sp. ML3]